MHNLALSRRDFLKNASVIGGLALIGPVGDVLGGTVAGTDGRRFRFVFANDLHMAVPFDKAGAYAGSNQRAQWLIDQLAGRAFGELDFVIFGGDMVHGAKLEQLNVEMPAFRKLVKRIDYCRLFPVVGNHENMQNEADPVYEKAYWKTFGPERAQYSFEHKGVLFVVLNNSGDPPRKARREKQEGLRARRLQYLKNAMAARPDLPKIVVCHIPITPMRDPEVLEKSFGFPSWHALDEALLREVENPRNQVRAVFSGHLHLTGMVRKNGVTHVVPSGLASFPHDFAVCEVGGDRMDVRMVSAPSEMAQPYRSDIHGERRHKVDYTDSAHPTHALYCSGTEAERSFSIPLRG